MAGLFPQRNFRLRTAAASAALCLSLVQGGCGRHAQSALLFRVPPARHTVVALGDSLALGIGASDPSRGFMFALYNTLLARDPGAQITNYAVSGARVDDLLHFELPRAERERATDIWICAGGNDVTHATDVSRFSSQYTALLHSVRRRWPNAHIVVFGVPDVSRSPLFTGTSRAKLHERARTDNDEARRAAAGVGAVFVDLFALGKRIDPARDLSADNFHPNDAGYAAIAQYAQPVVLRALFQ